MLNIIKKKNHLAFVLRGVRQTDGEGAIGVDHAETRLASPHPPVHSSRIYPSGRVNTPPM